MRLILAVPVFLVIPETGHSHDSKFMDNAIKVAAGLAAFMFDTLRPARPEDACKIIEVRHSASRRLRIFPCEAAILAFDDPHRRFGEM